MLRQIKQQIDARIFYVIQISIKMRPLSKYLLTCAFLLVSMFNIALARPDSELTPSQRIQITVADNRSVYTTVGERNNYENLLRLSQPDGQYQLTAGMLNDGDNNIVFHRIDDQGIDEPFARLNLSTEVTYPDTEYLGILDFYGDGTSAPSSNTTLTNNNLPANWSTDGSGLVWQTSGYGTITTSTGLMFTVPEGYSNINLQLIVYVGSNARGGYFGYNYNSEGWYVTSAVTAGNAYVLRTFSGVNSGDVINIYGGEASGSSYYLAQSPDIALIAFAAVPSSLVPSMTVTPYISYKRNGDWEEESAVAGVSATIYSVNDTINLFALGVVTDTFHVSTADNLHPSYYNYQASLDANVILPNSGSTGLDFYASADFTAATGSSPTTAAFTGPNNWSFLATNVYTPTAGKCAYMLFYGSMMYLMPESFMGNSVNVTVTTSTGDDGAGDMYVNGILHTFTAGETFTWTIPVCAGGSIEFKSNGSTYSPDFTTIVISSGNGSALNVPAQGKSKFSAKRNADGVQNMPKPIYERKRERDNIIRIND